MQKHVALQLKQKIRELEKQFSNPDREYNHNSETFKCINITPLSDTVALATIEKNTGKHCNALFFYIKNFWIYFFPTDGHELGMYNYLSNNYRYHLEGFNYDKNFNIINEKINIDNLKTTPPASHGD